MPSFVDPLGASGLEEPAPPPAAGLAPLTDSGDALSAFGDALAAPAPATDPLAAPLLDLPGLLAPFPTADPPATPPNGPVGPDLAAGVLDPGLLDPGLLDPGLLDPGPLDTDTAAIDTAALAAAAAATSDLDTASLRLDELGQLADLSGPTGSAGPAAATGAAGTEPTLSRRPAGRLSAGLPRGWDPPSVPANRGWSREVPLPPPPKPSRRRVRPARAASITSGVNPNLPQLPPEFAAALARFQRRARGGRIAGRLFWLVVLALVATTTASLTHNGGLVYGVVVLAAGVALLVHSRRVARAAERPGGYVPPGD